MAVSTQKNEFKQLTADLEQIRAVRLPAVLQLVPVSARTWWRGVADGRFPKPVELGGVRVWRVADLKKLLCEGERS